MLQLRALVQRDRFPRYCLLEGPQRLPEAAAVVKIAKLLALLPWAREAPETDQPRSLLVYPRKCIRVEFSGR